MRIIEAQEQHLRWEMDRGRGGDAIQPFPVHIEPPFTPFHHTQPRKVRQLAAPPPQFTKVKVPPLSALSFLEVKLSPKDGYHSETREQLPLALGARYPVAFEVMGIEGKVALQFVATNQDAPNVIGQLQSHYPEAQSIKTADPVSRHSASFTVARSYRLKDSHLFQIRSEHRPESYAALLGILASLGEGEAGLFQVLFHPVTHPWHENIVTVATDSWDPSKSSFVDLPDLPRKAKSKIERPLFSVAVRLATSSPDVLARLERSFLSQYQSVENGLEAVRSPYPLQSIVGRYPQTPGMLLGARELAALVHLPDPSAAPGVPVMTSHEGQAPSFARQDLLIPLGVNRYRGVETSVGIPASWLPTHVAIFGVPGAGKSNLLTWFLSIVEAGYGLVFLDPAGDTAEWFLKLIPENRVKDVVYFNPGDREHPPALNVLEASNQREKEMLVVELLVSLKRLFHRSGELTPRMERILRQTIRTLIFSKGEKSLLDVRRLLRDEKYRTRVLATLDDPDLVDFWQTDFARMPTSAIDPILNRLSQFFEDPLLKNIVVQPNLIDFYQVMSEGKILICNLSKGTIGEDAATLLGSFILSRLQLAAMARANVPEEKRELFPVIVDEFQNYAGPGTDAASVRSLLTEARKMRVPFVLATQYMSQLDREVMTAIFGTVSTFVLLRCGPIDARWLQREVGSFTEDDILNLDTGHALVRMGLARDTFNVVTPRRVFPEKDFRDRIVEASRQRYCRSITEVESLLVRKMEEERVWLVDAQGNVYTEDDVKKGRAPSQRAQKSRPAEPTTEAEAPEAKAAAQQESAQVHAERKETAEHVQEDEKKGVVEAAKDVLFRRPSRKVKVTAEKGESQHRYLQSLIKRIAEEYGFRATIEMPTPDGQGRVDVSLEGRSKRIAIEVSMTTTDEHELSNITKCISAGYDKIVSCSPERRTLNKVKALVEKRLSETELEKVLFLRPEELPFFLETEAAEESSREETIKGYRVKVQYQPVDEAEKKAKREAVAQVILQALRRLKE